MNNFKKILVSLLVVVVAVTAIFVFIGKDSADTDGEIVEPYYDVLSEFIFDDCYIDAEGEDSLDLRKGPAKKYGLITTVSPDSEIEVLGFSVDSSEWLYVSCNDTNGWLPSKFITFPNEYSLEAKDFELHNVCRTKLETEANADLNVYATSDKDSDVVYKLKKCDIVEIFNDYDAKYNGLIEVSIYVDEDGYTSTVNGWADAENLERIGNLGETISNNEFADKLVYKVSDNITSYDEQCQYEAVVVDADKAITLRSDIDNESDIIADVEPMSLIYIIGKSHSTDEKVMVYCPVENKHGWIEKEYLAPVEALTVTHLDEGVKVDDTQYKYVGSEPLLIHNESEPVAFMSAPDENSGCILKVQKGAKYIVHAPFEGLSDWVLAEYDDGLSQYYGFIYAVE